MGTSVVAKKGSTNNIFLWRSESVIYEWCKTVFVTDLLRSYEPKNRFDCRTWLQQGHRDQEGETLGNSKGKTAKDAESGDRNLDDWKAFQEGFRHRRQHLIGRMHKRGRTQERRANCARSNILKTGLSRLLKNFKLLRRMQAWLWSAQQTSPKDQSWFGYKSAIIEVPQ